MIIGAGPIVIGQACEFDYSGTQACKALKEEGYRVVLVNSNPATIMTDPGFADRTYIETLTVEAAAAIIEAERPDALLPTMGGQTGLNLALDLAAHGVLETCGVELIGASIPAIKKAEDRDLFKRAMANIGLDLPRSGCVSTIEEGMRVGKEIGFPLIIRPSRTLGGTGAGFAHTDEELGRTPKWALEASPPHETLVEESIAGGKEFELEMMRDRPFIRREAVKVLKAGYADKAAAFKGIEDGLTSFYKDFPDVPKSSVERAVASARHAYERNVFPSMKVTSGSYANNVGHSDPGPSPFPGCYRCHDDNHKTKQGRAISQDCSLCHTIE